MSLRASLLAIVAVIVSNPASAQSDPAPSSSTPEPLKASSTEQLVLICNVIAAGQKSFERRGSKLRFVCTGEIAKALFDRLGNQAGQSGADIIDGTKTTRVISAKHHENTCWRDTAAPQDQMYGCVLIRPGNSLRYE